jgi:NADH:ubiquinone oxidoreductase subunit 3 (subunit A)
MQNLNNEKGQSTVEYILLLAVLVSLGVSVMNSARLKQFLGPNSEFFGKLRDRIEYSYRHGNVGLSSTDNSDYESGNHNSYTNPEDSNSRFYLPTDPYPASP